MIKLIDDVIVTNTEHFDVDYIDGKWWKIEMDDNSFGLMAIVSTNKKIRKFIVPNGMKFDFASIPQWAWSIIGPPTGYGKGYEYGIAACIHDYLYMNAKYNKSYSRKFADSVMLEIMKNSGVDKWRRNLMYVAVRVGGKKYFGRGFNK